MTSQEYDVFISHRSPDTKRNVVSVLSGMLRSKGITCFVDYQMDNGADATDEIDSAIKSSRVSIIIISPGFATSERCLDEVCKIMKKGAGGAPNAPHKVVPVFYDVQLVGQQPSGTSYEALRAVYNLKEGRFLYDSKTTLQWEISTEIVEEVEKFLIQQKIIPLQDTTMPISMECVHDYDVFICHCQPDTQHNVVSVLRGMLLSKGITSFVVGYGKNNVGSEFCSGIDKVIKNSRVHVIVLSPNFVNSKQCLKEVVYIMNMQGSAGTSDVSGKPIVLPLFYDVAPSTVLHQIQQYALEEVQGSTDESEQMRGALVKLSLLRGSEYKTASTFQWEALYDVAKKVEVSTKKVIPCNYDNMCETLYVKEINQVFMVLGEQKAYKDVFVIGIYGRNKSVIANLLVKTLGGNFRRVYELSNVMEKAYEQEKEEDSGITNELDKVSSIVLKMFSDLICTSTSDDVRHHGLLKDQTLIKRCQERLKDQRCLVVLDDLGNDINNIEKLLDKVKSLLRDRSLVVLASSFQQILRKLNVKRFINLPTPDRKRDFLTICYAKRDGINGAFLNQLRETFDMLGLDVRLLNEDEVRSNRSCLQDAKVILCIISKSFSSGESKSMFTNAAIFSKIKYGIKCPPCLSYPTYESIPKHLFEVDFEKAAFDENQFKSLVTKMAQTVNERY